jgi:sugar phosphate isomerase/epimerase
MAEVQGVSELALIATTFPLITLDEITAEGGSRVFEQMCENLKANGYSGLDISVQQILALGKLTFAGILERTGLKFIAKCYSSGGGCPTGIAACIANASITHPPQGRSVADHIAVFGAQVREIVTCTELRPFLITISGQSGRDYFTDAEVDMYIEAATLLSKEFGVTIQHETHRHRILFNPWTARDTVKRRPDLNILADLSHYCVVCEAPCDDPDLNEAIDSLIPRVTHIHARVGYAEGPQVPDVTDPRWQKEINGHVIWWKKAMKSMRNRCIKLITVTPEFLPHPYAPPQATSKEDISRCNAFIAQIVKVAFEESLKE